MGQKEFNMDMDRYLHKRTTKRSFSIKKKQAPVEDERVYYDRPKQGFLGRLFAKDEQDENLDDSEAIHEIEDELHEVEEEAKVVEMMEEDVEKKRESLIPKLFKAIRTNRPKEKEEFDESEVLEERIPELDEDVKEILKITFHWIEKLPKSRLKQFKESEDFEKYKLILMKYGLVKEK